ncbi:hypothetical protein BTH42_06070 [Burkholderia sp. SRS-W-2-2016]|uniref:NfrA family protein n=1 Tax=Burkholderia sp. SRS-W-2-2016 TaxID=1926878 RepID=UPI00094B0FFC|nr:bacteriophage N4 adsorption protein A [Burkholderia sp. SRS-W-2-2016]OLL32581.1 hypothetical protein BTH42_06070 [Burkholderia sp. SRS-W-2-2016]
MNRRPARGLARRRASLAYAALSAALAAAWSPAAADENLPLPLAGGAYRVAQRAYDEYARGDYDAALRDAREAVRLRPDVARLRTLLHEAETASRRHAQPLAVHPASGTEGNAQNRHTARDAATRDTAGRRTVAQHATTGDALAQQAATGDAVAQHAATRSTAAQHDAATQAPAPATATPAPQPQPHDAPTGAAATQRFAAEAYRAAADNRPQDAADLFQRALDAGGPNHELEGRRDAMRRQMAQQPAGDAYRALAADQLDEARAQIAQAIALAPDVMSYRLLLVNVLIRQQRYADAEQAAGDAIRVDDEDAVPVLLRGYLRQQQGRRELARADYARALGNDTLGDDDLRELRLYVADAYMAARAWQDADALLGKLPARDGEANWRRALIAYHREHGGQPPLLAPFLDCRVTPYGTVCNAQPAPSASNAMIAAIYRALGQHERAAALALARVLAASKPNEQRYRRVLAQALDANGEHSAAQQARAHLDPPAPDLEFAYLAATSGAPALALDAFQQIDAAGKLPPRALQDAAFSAINANDKPAAVRYFERGIDAADAGQLDATEQQRYDMRRSVDELERQFGAYVSLSYRGSNNMQTGQNQSALVGDNLQLGTEAYWRPRALEHDGAYVDLYARLTGTPYSAPSTSTDRATGATFTGSSPTGLASLLSAFGVRWKPLAGQNAILAFERQQAIGSKAQSDWLARLGYSNGVGTDLRYDRANWNSAQVYAETGYYTIANTYYFTSELQGGRSFRLPEAWFHHTTLEPLAVLGADYNNAYNTPLAVGVGVGVNLRTWFREDRYHAPRSYLDVSIQYRVRIAGDDRATGWFIRSVFNF